LIEFVSQRQCNLATSCRVLHRGVETEMCLFPVDGGIIHRSKQVLCEAVDYSESSLPDDNSRVLYHIFWLRVFANYWDVKAPEIEKRRDWIFGGLPLLIDG